MSKAKLNFIKSSDPSKDHLNVETYDESMRPLFALSIDEKTRELNFSSGPGGVPFGIGLDELRKLLTAQEKQLSDWVDALASPGGEFDDVDQDKSRFLKNQD